MDRTKSVRFLLLVNVSSSLLCFLWEEKQEIDVIRAILKRRLHQNWLPHTLNVLCVHISYGSVVNNAVFIPVTDHPSMLIWPAQLTWITTTVHHPLSCFSDPVATLNARPAWVEYPSCRNRGGCAAFAPTSTANPYLAASIPRTRKMSALTATPSYPVRCQRRYRERWPHRNVRSKSTSTVPLCNSTVILRERETFKRKGRGESGAVFIRREEQGLLCVPSVFDGQYLMKRCLNVLLNSINIFLN